MISSIAQPDQQQKTSIFRVILCVLMWALIGSPHNTYAEPTVARYGAGQTKITATDFQDWRQARADFNPNVLPPTVTDMILQTTMATEARRLELDQDVVYHIQSELMISKWLQPHLKQYFWDQVSADPQLIEKHYQALINKPQRPRKVRLYNLFKRFPPDANQSQREQVWSKMKDIRQQLVAGADFKQMASTHSDSQSRLKGGLIGNVPAGLLRPEIDAVAMKLSKEEISDVIETGNGLTLLYAEQIIDPPEVDRQALRERAKNRVERQAFEKAWSQFREQLKTQADIQYNWELLSEKPDAQKRRQLLAQFDGGQVSLEQAYWLVNADPESRQLGEAAKVSLTARIEDYAIRQLSLRQINTLIPQKRAMFERVSNYIRDNLLSEQLILSKVRQQFKPLTEAEIRAYFDTHRDQFERPAHYRLSAIAWQLDQQDIRKTYRKAEQVLFQLTQNQIGFEQAARQHSILNSADIGGDMGWISRHSLGARIGLDPLKAVLDLSVGETSGLVKSDQGLLWILRLTDFQEKRPYQYQEARKLAEQALGQQQITELEASVINDWLTKLEIKLSDDDLP